MDSDDEDELDTARPARSENIKLQETHEAEFEDFMAQRAGDMSDSRLNVVESVAVPTARLNFLDTTPAAMALDINERCKPRLERDGGVPTTATLNRVRGIGQRPQRPASGYGDGNRGRGSGRFKGRRPRGWT